MNFLHRISTFLPQGSRLYKLDVDPELSDNPLAGPDRSNFFLSKVVLLAILQ